MNRLISFTTISLFTTASFALQSTTQKSLFSKFQSIFKSKNNSIRMMTSTATDHTVTQAPIEYFRNDYKPCGYLTTDIYLAFKLSHGIVMLY